jgi:hypothetical protein
MQTMQDKSGSGISNASSILVSIAFSILAFLIGLGGIGIFIGAGEAANNAITAFAAVSFLFALLAGFFSWIAPRARWSIGTAMSAPVAILAILGSWSSSLLLPGAIWTVALTCVGAYLGSRARVRRSATKNTPPSTPASSQSSQAI